MIRSGSQSTSSSEGAHLTEIEFLLQRDFLPVTVDYRHGPNLSISESATDICDAFYWARNVLPHLKFPQSALAIDCEKIVVVGWAMGGQLAMSLAWTASQRGLRAPEAILVFCNSTGFDGKSASVQDAPPVDEIREIGSQTQIEQGNYRTPTFLVYDKANGMIPWQQSQEIFGALVGQGVEAGVALINDAPRTHDKNSSFRSEGWNAAVQGYEFISSYVFLFFQVGFSQ